MSRDRPDKIERDMPLYLKRVSDRCDADIEALVTTFLKAMEEAPLPPRLFHYTNTAGLEGILSNGNLWQSDIFTLNDASELVYTMQAAVAIVRANPGADEMKILSQQLAGFSSVEAARAVASYFVCSFATNGDDLPQWQAYADQARGYCLEFDTANLEAAFAKPGGVPIPNNSTFPVNYSEEELKALVGSIVVHIAQKVAFVRRVMPGSKEGFVAYMSDLLLTLALHLYRLALFFKHPAFRHEGEYRFLSLFGIASQVENVKLRRRGEVEVPYLEFGWRALAPHALKSIKIGPAANADEATAFVKQCLANAGIDNVTIGRSEIPFRG